MVAVLLVVGPVLLVAEAMLPGKKGPVTFATPHVIFVGNDELMHLSAHVHASKSALESSARAPSPLARGAII